jgi:hypothetical protein
MIDKVYDHIILELKENGKSNNIYFIISTLFNITILIINSAVQSDIKFLPVFIIFSILLVIVNLSSIIIIFKIKTIRVLLLKGLQKLYTDQNVSGYYDERILGSEKTKMNMMLLIIIFTGLTSIITPIILTFIRDTIR